MDPNDQNQSGNTQNSPTDLGTVPPRDPNDPSAQDLTTEALYGPSTPGVDLKAPPTPPSDQGNVTSPPPMDTQVPPAPDMTSLPSDTSMNNPPDPNLAQPDMGMGAPMDQGGQMADTIPADLPPNDYGAPNLAEPTQEAPLDQGNFYQEAQIPQDTLPDPGVDQPEESAPYEPYQQPQYDQPAESVPETQPMMGDVPPESPASATGLPPIPKRSKLPIIIVGVAIVLLLSAVAAFFLLSGNGGSTDEVPTPTEEPLTCEEDPENPDCIDVEPTEDPTASFTPLPTSGFTVAPSPSGNTRACELLGTCP